MTIVMLASAIVVSASFIAPSVESQNPFEAQSLAARRASLQVAAQEADTRPETVLPLLEPALQDPEGSVRLLAANLLGRIQSAAAARRASKALDQVVPTDATLNAISRCVDDGARAVRGNCVSALVFFWRGTPADLTARLMKRYGVETDPVMRGLLLSHLRRLDISDPSVQAAFVAGLGDPEYFVQYQAAQGVAATTPPDALERVAFQLENGDPRARDAFVAALVAYGQQAEKYVPLLEHMRAVETREAVREQIDRAIRQVRACGKLCR